MTRSLLPPLLALLALCAGSAEAQLFVVPTVAYPTIQDAIDAAPPGTVITVNGGVYDPIVIDKPLTITGTSSVVANSVLDPQTFQLVPPVTLDGPGSGVVVLEGMGISGTTDGSQFGQNVPGIAGGGFDELVLRDCSVSAPDWFFLTGLGIGQPAVDVGVPLVQVEGSTLTGGFTDVDVCDATNLADGAAGLVTDGLVSVSNSTITGGAGPVICLTFGCVQFPPNICDSFTGSGGPGLVCDTALIDFATTTIGGGAGQDVFCDENESIVCTMPDGEDVVARSVLSLGGQLVVPGTHDTIPEALDAAGDGDVILVLGGTHDPFLVDKAVTLIARPTATVISDFQGPAVRFSGPEQGRAALVNFALGGEAEGPEPTVTAIAFDDVALIDCTIDPLIVDDGKSFFTFDGAPGVSADVGHLLVSRTAVRGGDGSTALFGKSQVLGAGGPAVEALGTTTVSLLDATLIGGDGGDDLAFDDCDCGLYSGGEGGAALAGSSNGPRYASNTALVGGSGGVITCFIPSIGEGGLECPAPDGLPVASGPAPLDLGFDLVGSGTLALGGDWSLGWQATAPSVLLIVSPIAISPTPLPGAGVLYASLPAASITPLPGAGTFFVSGAIPDDPALTGVVATFQLYDPIEGLSRPVIEPFAP